MKDSNSSKNTSTNFSENEDSTDSGFKSPHSGNVEKIRSENLDSDKPAQESENPPTKDPQHRLLISDSTLVPATQSNLKPPSTVANPPMTSLSSSISQNPPPSVLPLPVYPRSGSDLALGKRKQPDQATSTDKDSLSSPIAQNPPPSILPPPVYPRPESDLALGKRKQPDQATSTDEDSLSSSIRSKSYLSTLLTDHMRSKSDQTSSTDEDSFYIEYLDHQNNTLKTSSIKDVLDLIVNYFTYLPKTAGSMVKEIKAIKGNFDLQIKVDKRTTSALKTDFVRYENHINPNFYSHVSTKNSSTMAYFYLTMMALIESETNKKLSFEDVLVNLKFYIAPLLRLAKEPSKENIPQNFLCHIGILKKTAAEAKMIKLFREKRGGQKYSVTDYINLDYSLFESVKKELLIGIYCCLQENNPALHRLRYCLLNSSEVSDGLGLKDVFQIANRSKEIGGDEISFTDPSLEVFRFPKTRNLPRKEIARDKISLLKFRLPAGENLSRKSMNLIESIDREIEVEKAQEKKAAESDTDVDNITKDFTKLQINDGERETVASQRVQDVENHSVPSIIRPRPIAATQSAVINITTTSQPPSQQTIQLASSSQSAFKKPLP